MTVLAHGCWILTSQVRESAGSPHYFCWKAHVAWPLALSLHCLCAPATVSCLHVFKWVVFLSLPAGLSTLLPLLLECFLQGSLEPVFAWFTSENLSPQPRTILSHGSSSRSFKLYWVLLNCCDLAVFLFSLLSVIMWMWVSLSSLDCKLFEGRDYICFVIDDCIDSA